MNEVLPIVGSVVVIIGLITGLLTLYSNKKKTESFVDNGKATDVFYKDSSGGKTRNKKTTVGSSRSLKRSKTQTRRKRDVNS